MTPVTAAQAHQQLERILKSRAFSKATRLRQFLRFLIEKKIGGEEYLLKETVLGIEVFRRGRDFDPKADPIVRVDARRLRTRLAEYYSREGTLDPVHVRIEPGSYVPIIEARRTRAVFGARTIAVMPFVAVTSHPQDEYFSRGLAEEVINSLAQRNDIEVFASGSGAAQSAGLLVCGSIRREETKLRISIRVVAAKDSSVLWSRQYDTDAAQIFFSQERISRDLSIAVHAHTLREDDIAGAGDAELLFCPAAAPFPVAMTGTSATP
ncbi:MAG TPA: hypothetical protein VKX49_08885 [Bryobacteraceae bacterium]|nr:hypothetical protein [Bryobacteraceae bacterium]